MRQRDHKPRKMTNSKPVRTMSCIGRRCESYAAENVGSGWRLNDYGSGLAHRQYQAALDHFLQTPNPLAVAESSVK